MTARRVALLVPVWAWMGAFFLLPFAIILWIAFGEAAETMPPYLPPIIRSPEGDLVLAPNFASFALIFEDAFYIEAAWRSLRVAALTVCFCLALGYPMALAIARAPEGWRAGLLALVILPFWTSFLLRITAWIGILQDQGWINAWALRLGVIEEPWRLLYTDAAMLVGMVYCYLPFMILPLYATLGRLDPLLREAAADLGARPWQVFLRVTLPLSLPGIVAGSLLVFIPAAGEFVIPELLGGPEAQLLGRVVWTEFFQNRDWPLASALSVLLLAALVLPIILFQRRRAVEEA